MSTDSACLFVSEEELEIEGNPPSTLEGLLGREAKRNKSDSRKIHTQTEVASTNSDHPLVSDLEAERGSDAEELSLPSDEHTPGTLKHKEEPKTQSENKIEKKEAYTEEEES